ncbi:MAG: hypothetical protein J6V72_11050 [Kiritimatiellae bacterium]|nr:hypothetical protein [Kiritimatiellia bacterium]
MVADLARRDFEALRAEGLNPTLDDFDRLNLLATRLEAGPETTAANHPRIGWAGDVPFHEPTACALMWLQDYAARVKCDAETRQAFFYFACAHATDPAAFAGLETPRAIEKAVKAWLRKTPCTEREMARACHYAAWGFDDAVAAPTERKLDYMRRTGKTAAMEHLERLERITAQAAAATGLSYLDLMAQTPSRLNAMVVAAQVEAGFTVSRDMAKAQVDYTATLHEIRERLRSQSSGVRGQSSVANC